MDWSADHLDEQPVVAAPRNGGFVGRVVLLSSARLLEGGRKVGILLV